MNYKVLVLIKHFKRIHPCAHICKKGIHKSYSSHGLHNDHGAWNDDWIMAAFDAHINFFLPRKRKTIVLASDSPQFQLSGVPVLNIYESEEKLVKNILKLHQHAHHNGYPVKDMPPMIPAEHPQVLLSAREIEVLVLITKGLINKEIADKLNISLTTVITHRKNITEKLGIKSVSGLTIYAVMNGYIEADRI